MGLSRLGVIPGAAGAVFFLLLLSGCATYPYQSAFSACDNAAGTCYQYCEQFAGNAADYSACHTDCEIEADRCFANAYGPYGYSGSAYASSGYSTWPWYGRYGWWGPRQGYYFDFTYFERYPRYSRPYPGYRYRDRPRRDRHGDGDRGGRRRHGDNNDGGDRPRRRNPSGGNDYVAPPPRTSPPPSTPPPFSAPPMAAPPTAAPPPARTQNNTTRPRRDSLKTDPE